MKETFQVSVLVIFAIACVSSLTPVYECDNGIPLPSRVQVNDCEVLPCPFARGSTVVMNATFKAGMYLETIRPEVIANAYGALVDYPLNELDGCKTLVNTRCPLDEGENTIYQLRMPVLIIFPRIPLVLKFTLYGNDAPQVCFMIDAEVV